MPMDLSLLYRGPLASCNYGCGYCPFAKRRETNAQLAGDRTALNRFVDWCTAAEGLTLGILFTPWGEALVRSWYREAMVRLSHLPHVRRVACQTNLSCGLDWLAEADRETLALWCTFHPGETDRQRFLDRCLRLHTMGIRHSVGVVGLKEHFTDIDWLRERLPAGVYLWVNAYKRVADYYGAAAVDRLTAVDPLFGVNNVRHESLGKACRTGESVLSIAGDGTLRRCHFVDEPIGNLYQPGWRDALRPRRCPNRTCGCHIGHVHLEELRLHEVFGAGVLERVPEGTQWVSG